jgi:hypothetical protein
MNRVGLGLGLAPGGTRWLTQAFQGFNGERIVVALGVASRSIDTCSNFAYYYCTATIRILQSAPLPVLFMRGSRRGQSVKWLLLFLLQRMNSPSNHHDYKDHVTLCQVTCKSQF